MRRRLFLGGLACLGAGTAQAAYFAPALNETVDISSQPGNPVYTGDHHDLAVTCDLSRRLYFFSGGEVAWYRDIPISWPRGLDYFEGLLWFAYQDMVISHNPRTAYPHHVWRFPGRVTSLQFSRDHTTVYLTVCIDTPMSVVQVYRVYDGQIFHHFTNPHPIGFPRSAYVDGGWLFIADTFLHRVYAVDLASGGMRFELDVIYPNYVEPTDDPNEIRITAEHSNRVILYNHTTGDYAVEMACPVWPFDDEIMRADQIWPHIAGTAAPGIQPTKSLCAVGHAGPNTLYSPNAVRFYPGLGHLVSDTDNQRVVLFGLNGEILTEITGLNNPSNACLIK